MHHCHTKLPYQKPMLRETEWWLQNRPNTKNGVLPVTTLFFRKFCFSLRTSYKELICCTDNPNAHNCIFCKRWSFIWRCFFPVSIHKVKTYNLPEVKKSSPPNIPCEVVVQNEKIDGHFQQILVLWKLEWRIHSGENQVVPVLISWVIQLFVIGTFQTVLNFYHPFLARQQNLASYAKQDRSIHLS